MSEQSLCKINKKETPSQPYGEKNNLRNAQVQLLWTLTDSNRRPSACKADALNQLS